MPRAVIAARKDEAGMLLNDESGKLRVGLGVYKESPGLFLFDEEGKEIWSAP